MHPSRTLPLALAACALAACAIPSPAAAQLYHFSQKGEKNGAPVITECIETERRPHSSVISFSVQGAGSVGWSMFQVFCVYQVARLRGMRYALTLREGDPQDGRYEVETGFTNSPETDLPKLFGRPATAVDHLMDTRKFAPMFDKVDLGKP